MPEGGRDDHKRVEKAWFIRTGQDPGESAYLLEGPTEYLAHVEEGLGTKNLVADAMLKQTGKSYYKNIGIDTVATMVNDLISCGAMPISIAMHAAVGDASFFNNATRANDLAEGFAEGCRISGAVWGGGETPALKGIVHDDALVLAGSAIGRIYPKSNRVVNEVQSGDAIVLLGSSGVQTNGLTLCRKLAERLKEGYLTKMEDGRMYGEALLDASVIYVDFVAGCQEAGLKLNYLSHMTGHGWRKLMRLDEPFVYRMHTVPPVLPIFNFIMKHGPVELKEAFATFNMGVGFAAYVKASDAEKCVSIARAKGYSATVAGEVVKEGNRKAVEILPLKMMFEGETLKVR